MSVQRPKLPVRVNVKVIVAFDLTGAIMPREIIWKDGRVFKIDAVRDFRPASILGPGHTGDCYTVIIRGETRFLFFERTDPHFRTCLGRWWVECPAA